jgi:hypothetical protein
MKLSRRARSPSPFPFHNRWRSAAVAAACLAATAVHANTPPAAEPVAVPPAVRKLAGDIAAELAANCPLAPANDSAAFNACRKALYGESTLRAHLQPVLLWGRQSKNPQATLRQTNLTQFSPEVWTNLYAPLFMFNGKHTVEWVAEEKRFLVRLEAAFRNRLSPGEFPYPFWHEAEKWGTYEQANGFMLWLDPAGTRIAAAQFTNRAPNAMLHAVTPVQHAKFDGAWLWTDPHARSWRRAAPTWRAASSTRGAIDRTTAGSSCSSHWQSSCSWRATRTWRAGSGPLRRRGAIHGFSCAAPT